LVACRIDDRDQSYKGDGFVNSIACEITMIAPAAARAPRMLLVIGKDEQGLPAEMIIPDPSVSQLYDALRAWLATMLPGWLGNSLRPTRRIDANLLPAPEPALIDVRVRLAGL
jgi:hypothetical protein